MDNFELLQQVSILQSLPVDEIKHLAALVEPKSYAAGDVVIRDGDRGTYLYFVASGAAKVRMGSETVALQEPGDCFGEMALLDDSPRSATITMVKDGVLLRLHRDVFLDLVQRRPDMYKNLYKLLADRIRTT
jgi:CRP-like cAMP-binding protein